MRFRRELAVGKSIMRHKAAAYYPSTYPKGKPDGECSMSIWDGENAVAWCARA